LIPIFYRSRDDACSFDEQNVAGTEGALQELGVRRGARRLKWTGLELWLAQEASAER
jgi:hypothetical protein